MNVLLTIDPGTNPNGRRNAGWAWFNREMLCACGVGLWNEIPVGGANVEVVIEKPQIYRASRSKGDPNNMVKLAWIAGEIANRARCVGSTVGQVDDMPHPADWKAQTPKEIMCRRILKVLSPAEAQVVAASKDAKNNNMIDAIGIGLWKLNRMKCGG